MNVQVQEVGVKPTFTQMDVWNFARELESTVVYSFKQYELYAITMDVSSLTWEDE